MLNLECRDDTWSCCQCYWHCLQAALHDHIHSWGVGLVEVTGIGHCSALGGGTYVGGVMGDTGLRPGVGHLARGGDRQLALGHCSVLETGSCGHKAGSWHTIIGLCWSRIMSEDRAEAGVTSCPAPLSLWNVLQHLLELGPQTIITTGWWWLLGNTLRNLSKLRLSVEYHIWLFISLVPITFNSIFS